MMQQEAMQQAEKFHFPVVNPQCIVVEGCFNPKRFPNLISNCPEQYLECISKLLFLEAMTVDLSFFWWVYLHDSWHFRNLFWRYLFYCTSAVSPALDDLYRHWSTCTPCYSSPIENGFQIRGGVRNSPTGGLMSPTGGDKLERPLKYQIFKNDM